MSVNKEGFCFLCEIVPGNDEKRINNYRTFLPTITLQHSRHGQHMKEKEQ
jgi:hypothetical protein